MPVTIADCIACLLLTSVWLGGRSQASAAERNRDASLLAVNRSAINLNAIDSPIIFKGDAETAFRDPAAIYHEGVFHLYFTLVKRGSDGKPYSYVAWSKSTD